MDFTNLIVLIAAYTVAENIAARTIYARNIGAVSMIE